MTRTTTGVAYTLTWQQCHEKNKTKKQTQKQQPQRQQQQRDNHKIATNVIKLVIFVIYFCHYLESWSFQKTKDPRDCQRLSCPLRLWNPSFSGLPWRHFRFCADEDNPSRESSARETVLATNNRCARTCRAHIWKKRVGTLLKPWVKGYPDCTLTALTEFCAGQWAPSVGQRPAFKYNGIKWRWFVKSPSLNNVLKMINRKITTIDAEVPGASWLF